MKQAQFLFLAHVVVAALTREETSFSFLVIQVDTRLPAFSALQRRSPLLRARFRSISFQRAPKAGVAPSLRGSTSSPRSWKVWPPRHVALEQLALQRCLIALLLLKPTRLG